MNEENIKAIIKGGYSLISVICMMVVHESAVWAFGKTKSCEKFRVMNEQLDKLEPDDLGEGGGIRAEEDGKEAYQEEGESQDDSSLLSVLLDDGEPVDVMKDVSGKGEKWRRMWRMMLPFVISYAIHLTLVVMAMFVVWTTITIINEVQTVVPNVKLSKQVGTPLWTMKSGGLNDMSIESERTISKIETVQTSLSPSPTMDVPLIELAGGVSALNPFDVGEVGGMEFKTTFFGLGGNARTIVFVVDASGSLIDTLPLVLKELQSSIRMLSDKQNFTVIFFQGERVIEVPPVGLKQATVKLKRDVIRWVDPSEKNISPEQQTNPVGAIKKALKYEPDLVYLLSDNITGHGQYEVDQARLLRSIKMANKGKAVINTIQFLYEDPLVKQGQKSTLRMIADQTKGDYRFIRE